MTVGGCDDAVATALLPHGVLKTEAASVPPSWRRCEGALGSVSSDKKIR